MPADFLTAYKTVKGNEGGYRNVSWDHGGETYKGIARNSWPNWLGWKIIDQYKAAHGPIKQGAYISDTALDNLVHQFFQDNFWTRNKLQLVNNQSLATLCLDMSINHGKGPLKINEALKVYDETIPLNTTVTSQAITYMNKDPQHAYNAIAAKRIEYIKSLQSYLGPDYNSVLQRAVSFVSKYKDEIIATGGSALALFGFFLHSIS